MFTVKKVHSISTCHDDDDDDEGGREEQYYGMQDNYENAGE